MGTTRGSQHDGQPPSVRGSTRQVLVEDAVPGATVTLYGPEGATLADAVADDLGSHVFRDISPGTGYQVSQTVDGTESERSESVEVLSVEYTPPQSLYDDQTIEAGFGYLEVRDGTKLAYQVQFPEGEGPHPVLVMYSGYAPSVNLLVPPELVNSLGYAIVGVNKRGTQCSGGKYDLWEKLQWLDGYDMIETIGAQDWANGIGLIGASYPGYSQFYVAAEQPPSLDAIAPGLPVGDFYRDVGWPGGMLNEAFAGGWAASRDSETKPYTDDSGLGDVAQRVENDPVCAENHTLRLQNRSTAGRLRETEFATEFYESRSPWNFVDQIDVPTLMVVSWQDDQVGSRAARLLERFSDDTTVRFIGTNGGHDTYTAVAFDLVDFFDQHVTQADGERFREESVGDESTAPYRIRWEGDQNNSARFETRYEEWPPGETWELYLQPDSQLGDTPPEATDASSSYEFVSPSIPDQTITDEDDILQWSQRSDETHTAFVSEQLAEDRVCVGSGMVELWLKSTAADTDLQVTLSEVRPGGTEMYVQEGLLRASHRAENPELTKPRRPYHTHKPEDAQPLPDGEFARMRVELFPFAHVFRKGSRVKLTISNPGGTRQRWGYVLVDETATNEVAHTAGMPSKLALPLVPGEAAPLSEPPECGTVAHQPCRPVDSERVDPPAVLDAPPLDLDGDGLHEDVRGDGSADIFDVQTLFRNLDSETVTNNPGAFDFQGDGSGVSIADVQALFDRL